MWELDYKESWAWNWCFWTVVLEKTLQSLLDCKEIQLQYFGVSHLMWRTDSLEKTLMQGKIEGRRRRGQQRMRWLDGITDLMDMSWASSRSWWRSGKPGVLQSMGLKRVGQDWATELNWYSNFCFLSSLRLKFNSLSLVRKTMVVIVYITLLSRIKVLLTVFQCLKRIVSYVLPSFILIYSRKAGPFIPVTVMAGIKNPWVSV